MDFVKFLKTPFLQNTSGRLLLSFHGSVLVYRFGFPAFTGILSLGFYIHNAILSVLVTNENPENNVSESCFFSFINFKWMFVHRDYLIVSQPTFACLKSIEILKKGVNYV